MDRMSPWVVVAKEIFGRRDLSRVLRKEYGNFKFDIYNGGESIMDVSAMANRRKNSFASCLLPW